MAALSLTLTACVGTETHSGHVVNTEAVSMLIVGKSTKDDALREMGSPSTTSTFDGERWYYVSKKTQAKGILNPKLIEHRVIEMEFGEDGILKQTRNYTEKEMKNFSISSDKTETGGQTYGILQQLLGNVGKFSKQPADER